MIYNVNKIRFYIRGLNLIKKMGILQLKGNAVDMAKKKEMTVEEYKAEIKRLKEENLRLTVENEYIKKLNALVTQKEKSQKKKSQQ